MPQHSTVRALFSNTAARTAAAEAERAAAAAARGRKAVANALKHGGRRTRKSRGMMASVKKFFGMTRSRRGRSRRQ